MTLQEQYKKETGTPPWVYLEYKYGRKYTENYVEWLENKIKTMQDSAQNLLDILGGVV